MKRQPTGQEKVFAKYFQKIDKQKIDKLDSIKNVKLVYVKGHINRMKTQPTG